MDTYAALRAHLNARLQDIIGRVTRIERDLRRPADRDWTEEAIVQENDEVLEGLDALERDEVAAIRATLRRIESGEYGRCRRCGGAISPSRLDAMPTADTCVACASYAAATSTAGK